MGAVERARACVGARFRPQGRTVERGLDCVGVVAVAWGLPAGSVRRDYRLRARDVDELARELGSRFQCIGKPAPGDAVLVDAGRGQPHLVILTPNGFVHADAGAGRVLEVPGPVPWPVRSAWRRKEGEGS